MSTQSMSSADLVERARGRLSGRIASSNEYCQEELRRVLRLNTRLFPAQYELDSDATERFRALCLLSRTTLKQDFGISSHRRFIGPMIVACKRFLLRIIRPQLEETVQGIESFCSWMVASHADQEVRLIALGSRRNVPEE